MPDVPPGTPRSREPAVLLALCAAAFVVLGFDPPADRFTWAMENFPVVLAAPLLVATRGRFPLTPLAYRLLLLHALVLMVGGHWTYAKVPAGEWARDLLGLERNHYDRFGHFVQGFVPALIAREVLLRTSPLRPGGWLSFLVVCVCTAVSAAYEFLEWWTALATGEAAEAFLGTQGDPWDTQWDMFLAAAGATACVALLSRLHDRQLAANAPPGPGPGVP